MFKSITVKLMTFASNLLSGWAGGLVASWVSCHHPANLDNIQCERLLTKTPWNSCHVFYYAFQAENHRNTGCSGTTSSHLLHLPALRHIQEELSYPSYYLKHNFRTVINFLKQRHRGGETTCRRGKHSAPTQTLEGLKTFERRRLLGWPGL